MEGARDALVLREVAAQEDRVRRQALRRAQRHRRVHAEGPRLVGGRRHHAAAARVAADDDGLAPQRRVARLLHRHEEGVQVYVKDLPRHRMYGIARMFYGVNSINHRYSFQLLQLRSYQTVELAVVYDCLSSC